MALVGSAPAQPGADHGLIERDAELGALAGHFAAVAEGEGRMLLVRGEAGIGKTALVRQFLSGLRGVRVFAGACDGVSTPRIFGPLHDMVPALGPELADLLERSASRHQVAAWLVGRLTDLPPHVVIIEDISWADDATLDLLVHLAKRMSGLRTLVIATCRDAEPVRGGVEQVLGILAGAPAVRQLVVPPISPDGVAILASGSAVDPAELHRLTSGNPFFVTEVLAGSQDALPISVRDAIRARITRLDDRARRALGCAAVLGTRFEPWLVAAVAGEDVLGIDDCLAAGLLIKSDGIAFRHGLTRMTVLDDLPVIEGIGIHRRALEALRLSGSTDHARLAYHAEGAADASEVLTHAVAAAEAAIAARSNREGAAQYARVLRFLDGQPDQRRADLLERAGWAFFVINQTDEAIAARRRAADIRERLGDPRGVGDNLRHLAYMTWIRGHAREAHELARRAVAMLEPLEPGRELAMAWSTLGQLAMIAHDRDGAMAWSRRALDLGRSLDDAEVIAHALNNIGAADREADWRTAEATLLESRRIAAEAWLPWHVHRALFNLAGFSLEQRRLAEADRYYAELIEHSSAAQVERCNIEVNQAGIRLETGAWEEAERLATSSLNVVRSDSTDRAQALVIIARLRAMRGESGGAALLAEADEIVRGFDDLERRWLLAQAKAEAAWLAGAMDEVVPELESAYADACRLRSPWIAGDLGRWLWRAGRLTSVDEIAPRPHLLEVAGHARQAADEWDRRGMVLEAALSLAGSSDPVDLREAHDRLTALGATAAARVVAERLQRLGEAVPRGPRRTTRDHPAGLTSRQAEIALLIAEGLTNREIASRLVLTEKTVDHHVSAVLAKLGARRRMDVAERLSTLQAPGADAPKMGIAAS